MPDYCNITTDLTDVDPNINDYALRRVIDNWTVVSGQTYTYYKAGLGDVQNVFEAGLKLTESTSIALVEATAGLWWYDSTIDILYVHPTDNQDPADVVLEYGEDWDDFLTVCRDKAQEKIDARLNKRFVTPLVARVVQDHSSNLYEQDIVEATANLICYFVKRRRDPASSEAIAHYKIAINPNPEPDEIKGIIDQYLDGEIVRQDQVSPREALGANIFPASGNTTTEPGILLEGKYEGDTFQIWLLTITTGGAPGTALYTLSLDNGTTDTYTSQETLKTGSNVFVALSQGIRARFPQSSYTQNDTWTIEVYPIDSTLEGGSVIGSLSLRRV